MDRSSEKVSRQLDSRHNFGLVTGLLPSAEYFGLMGPGHVPSSKSENEEERILALAGILQHGK
jgi:hypothetical protein